MARIRSIKPEFWTDEKVVSLPPLARLFFIGLWNFADDEGRGEYSPARLKMQILPADSADPSELLGAIRRNSMIVVYEVENKEYFQIVNFHKHQKVDARRPSRLPPPPSCADPRRIAPTDRDMDREKDRSSVSNETDAQTASRVVEFPDARTVLFSDGLQAISAMTGKPPQSCRGLLGRWLKQAGDDAAVVMATIRRATANRVAEPVAWIERSLKPHDPDEAIYRGVR